MLRMALALVLMVTLTSVGFAQEEGTPAIDRSATGGAQTLDDILARQAGQKLDDSFRSDAIGDPDNAAGIAAQLGTLGGVSDAETWRALRYGSANVKVSAGGDVATVLVQDGGMRWHEFRDTTLRTYGGWLLVGTLAALLVFYLLKGRIKIDEGRAGRTVTRFKAIERFGHWLMAGSFILLGITGVLVLFGRVVLVPLFGKEANAFLLVWSKWIHNNVSWAFILGLVMVFVMWVVHNIPNRTDLHWLRRGGGILFAGDHPPAKKFNAGQKMIFWSVILFGGSISLTGVSLLFPFDLPLFAKSFHLLNATGLPQAIGLGELPIQLAPQEEMQLAQAWHAILAFVLMAIVFAHIYIGSVGMEGAYDAMGTGEVDEAWAEQHHSIWLEEYKAAEREGDGRGAPTAAE
ncbi:MAG: formate dehydrogenase subunit gamma [Pseudomonadota bacterium]|nr:formate dehydrogenase subunit gamma [Pseudomonadota bacterium]